MLRNFNNIYIWFSPRAFEKSFITAMDTEIDSRYGKGFKPPDNPTLHILQHLQCLCIEIQALLDSIIRSWFIHRFIQTIFFYTTKVHFNYILTWTYETGWTKTFCRKQGGKLVITTYLYYNESKYVRLSVHPSVRRKPINGIDWPVRSSDSDPCDFFLWGYLKVMNHFLRHHNIKWHKTFIQKSY